jgi:hypothetical protein
MEREEREREWVNVIRGDARYFSPFLSRIEGSSGGRWCGGKNEASGIEEYT